LEKGLGEFRKECDCRKGRPGLLFQASTDLDIDLKRSYMVGDKIADIEAGENAGCQPILVLTGYGQESRLRIDENRAIICADLASAVGVILGHNKSN
jgi:D-glycero-D-manno-heptose 1,7-bisphosphate phosphatase